MSVQSGQMTRRQLEAFEYYYMLGENRSYGKVARQFNVSNNAVMNWANKHHWHDRVVARDNENFQVIQELNNKEVIADLLEYRKLVRESLADYKKRLNDGKIKIDNIKDFAKLVQLDMELCGYANSISEKTEQVQDSGVEVNLSISLGGDADED